MPIAMIEEKIKRLPESYIELVNDYIDELLIKAGKVNALRGAFSKYADKDLREKEKDAWKNAAMEKHLNG